MHHYPHKGPPRQVPFVTLNLQEENPPDNLKKKVTDHNIELQFRHNRDPNANWVLATGFPCGATDRIMNTFRCVGRIVDKHWSQDGLYVQFSSPCESARAVELNDLGIAGYPVRIKALPRLTGHESIRKCPDRSSLRRLDVNWPEVIFLESGYLRFFRNLLSFITGLWEIFLLYI